MNAVTTTTKELVEAFYPYTMTFSKKELSYLFKSVVDFSVKIDLTREVLLQIQKALDFATVYTNYNYSAKCILGYLWGVSPEHQMFEDLPESMFSLRMLKALAANYGYILVNYNLIDKATLKHELRQILCSGYGEF